jgi:hypothetical protein
MPKSLREFRLATPDECDAAEKVAAQHNGRLGAAVGSFAVPPIQIASIDPTEVYMVMHQAFGPPNSRWFDPSKTRWEWIVYTPDGLLAIYDWKEGLWSIGYRGVTTTRPSDALITQADAIRAAIATAVSKITVTAKERRAGHIAGQVRNPYALFSNIADGLMEQAEEYVRLILSYDEGSEDWTQWHYAQARVGQLFSSALVNVILSMEGFVNLVYMLFLRDRYRGLEIYERRLRNEMLPVKVLEMDMYCHSFDRSPLAGNKDLLDAISHLIEVRNLIIHANVSDAMHQRVIMKGGYPLRIRNRPSSKFGIPIDVAHVTNKHVVQADMLVDKLIVSVIKAMSRKVRRDFATVHWLDWIYYEMPMQDTVRFDWKEEYTPSQYRIRKFFSQSTALDSEYYNVGVEEFLPQLSNFVPEAHPIPTAAQLAAPRRVANGRAATR